MAALATLCFQVAEMKNGTLKHFPKFLDLFQSVEALFQLVDQIEWGNKQFPRDYMLEKRCRTPFDGKRG